MLTRSNKNTATRELYYYYYSYLIAQLNYVLSYYNDLRDEQSSKVL